MIQSGWKNKCWELINQKTKVLVGSVSDLDNRLDRVSMSLRHSFKGEEKLSQNLDSLLAHYKNYRDKVSDLSKKLTQVHSILARIHS